MTKAEKNLPRTEVLSAGLNMDVRSLPRPTQGWQRLGRLSVRIKTSEVIPHVVSNKERTQGKEMPVCTRKDGQVGPHKGLSVDEFTTASVNLGGYRSGSNVRDRWLPIRLSSRRKHEPKSIVWMKDDVVAFRDVEKTGPPLLSVSSKRVRGGPPDKNAYRLSHRCEAGRKWSRSTQERLSEDVGHDWWDGYGPPARSRHRPPPSSPDDWSREVKFGWTPQERRKQMDASSQLSRWLTVKRTGDLFLTDEDRHARRASGQSREGPPGMELNYA